MFTEREKGIQREGEVRNSKQWKNLYACVHPKSLQSCLTLYDPMDCSPSGSSVHGISQARILPSSGGSSQLRDQTQVSYVSCLRSSLPLVPPGKLLICLLYLKLKKKKRKNGYLMKHWRRQKEIESRTQVTEVVLPRSWRGTRCSLRPTILASIL